MGKLLEGQVAIVTGSGQGIGRAIALKFAEEGAKVVTNNRKPGATKSNMMTDEQYNKLTDEKKKWYDEQYAKMTGDAETTAQAIRDAGGEATAFFGDFSKWEVAQELVETTIAKYGKIDILCNVAGNFGFADIDQISEELWDSVNVTKPKGYFNVMRFAIPYMKKQGYGRILNCASPAWIGDDIKHAEYCAANAGVVGLSKGAAKELLEFGITVNAFAPYANTRADYEAKAISSVLDEGKKLSASGVFAIAEMDTPGPEYVAPFITYLASKQSGKVSGSVFMVGGTTVALYSEPVPSKALIKSDPDDTSPWTIEDILAKADTQLFDGYVSPAVHQKLY
ncbi:MAG: SDR family oxidoreductase [Oscillospiraceae bacterium]|jgi:3-oxoacyl-[acyl-carrier protein] reductase|nr:SDR family oxidoreductase [Oscillospiraceae bacterium]